MYKYFFIDVLLKICPQLLKPRYFRNIFFFDSVALIIIKWCMRVQTGQDNFGVCSQLLKLQQLQFHRVHGRFCFQIFDGFCPGAAKDFLTAFLSWATFCVCRSLTENVLNCIKRPVSKWALIQHQSRFKTNWPQAGKQVFEGLLLLLISAAANVTPYFIKVGLF